MIQLLYILLVCLLVGVDQVVKWWVASSVSVNTVRQWIPGLMALTNLHNRGAAWSLFLGAHTFFIIITIVALVVILTLMVHLRNQVRAMVPLCFILAGTIGNFIDRLVHGYVVDMFEFLPVNFPVFNVADTCLTVGVFCLAVVILREGEFDDSENHNR